MFTAKGKMERDSQNYPIQGCAASMTKLASIFFMRDVERSGFSGKIFIVNMVHDEIVVQADKDISDWAKKRLSMSMEKAGSVFVKSLPMPAEVKISWYWTK